MHNFEIGDIVVLLPHVYDRLSGSKFEIVELLEKDRYRMRANVDGKLYTCSEKHLKLDKFTKDLKEILK